MTARIYSIRSDETDHSTKPVILLTFFDRDTMKLFAKWLNEEGYTAWLRYANESMARKTG